MRGNLFRSNDDGRSWSQVPSPRPVSLYAGTRTADDQLLLAGQGGVVLASGDGGRTFRVLRETGQENLTGMLVPRQGPWLLTSDAGLRRLDPAPAEQVSTAAFPTPHQDIP
jgi:photosystem II stability/assembly factor-like uncharacterized protein